MMKRVSSRCYLGAGTKSHGKTDVVYRKGASTRKSGNGKTSRKRVAGK
jgi:hypothetical protein